MTPPWFERAVKLGREAFDLHNDDPDQVRVSEDAARDVLELALPALLDGLCPFEPSEEEYFAAVDTKGDKIIDMIRAANRARRARIEKEMEA